MKEHKLSSTTRNLAPKNMQVIEVICEKLKKKEKEKKMRRKCIEKMEKGRKKREDEVNGYEKNW